VLKALGFWAERRKLPAPVDACLRPQGNAPLAAANGSQSAEGAHCAPMAASPASLPQPREAGEPVEIMAVAPPAATAGPTAPPAGSAGEAAAEQWEEVWRPRRKGRAFEGSERHRAQRARQPDPDAPAPEPRPKPGASGTPRSRRPDRRRGPGERPERPRPHMHASPPSKAAFDPDSPFAALSSLKAQMEKRSQE